MIHDRPRMIVWFSCGAASAVAAKIAVEHCSAEHEVEVCYCDTLADEHSDNIRFLADVESWIGRPIKRLRNERYVTIAQVFRDQRFLVGPHYAPCTKLLKIQPRIDYVGGDPVIHVFGFTADEIDRIARFESRHTDMDCEWVLADRGITKDDCFRVLDAADIELPAMYRLGFEHNNCLGCVRGGAGYWNKIRRLFPDRFAEMASIEREIGATMLRLGGKRVYLDELDPCAGHKQNDDPPSCGVLCGYAERLAMEKAGLEAGA